MRKIRSTGMRPEMAVRRLVHALGYRYRLHHQELPGKPDIVLPRHAKIVFVHGCFWHQHSRCGEGRVPRSRQEYWLPKLVRNRERDRSNLRRLRRWGLVVWECETANQARLERRLQRFLDENL